MPINLSRNISESDFALAIVAHPIDRGGASFIREATVVSVVERPGLRSAFLTACDKKFGTPAEAFFFLYEASIEGFHSRDRTVAQAVEAFDSDLSWNIVSAIPGLLDAEAARPESPPVAYENNGHGSVYDAVVAYGIGRLVFLNDPHLDLSGYERFMDREMIDTLVKGGLRIAGEKFPRFSASPP